MQKREELIELAKLAEQAERYEDMARFMEESVALGHYALEESERNLLSVAYKNVVGARRSSWRVIKSVMEKSKEQGNKERAAICQQYLQAIEAELEEKSLEALQIIDQHIQQPTSDVEAEVFYKKMKGDYLRYLVEISSAHSNSREDRAEKSLEAYQDALATSTQKLNSTDPIHLGLALNLSIFHYEIQNDPAKACKIAKDAFDNAIAELDSLKEDSYKESTLIMQLLRDNLTLWSSENDNETEENE